MDANHERSNLLRLLLCGAFASCCGAHAAPVHVVNGLFDPTEWTVSNVNGAAARPTVATTSFTVGGVVGGGVLYAEQTKDGDPTGSIGNKLELMYECTVCTIPIGFGGIGGLDVFFQSGSEDYAVRIFGPGAYQAYEKATGVLSPLNPDGSLNLNSPIWTPLTAADLAIAAFSVSVRLGSSPNSATPHLLAEFELGVEPNGLYKTDPAFWSASKPGGDLCRIRPDPRECGVLGAIGSARFTLNPDGTITLVPVVGPGGGPVVQIPAPGSLALSLLGLALLAGGSKVRRSNRREDSASHRAGPAALPQPTQA